VSGSVNVREVRGVLRRWEFLPTLTIEQLLAHTRRWVTSNRRSGECVM
jgi:hypothetical protein